MKIFLLQLWLLLLFGTGGGSISFFYFFSFVATIEFALTLHANTNKFKTDRFGIVLSPCANQIHTTPSSARYMLLV